MDTTHRIPFRVLLGLATAFGVSSTFQAYWLGRVSGSSEPMHVHLFVLNSVYWYVPALLAPLIIKLATRYRIGRVPWYVFLGIHVTGALSYSVIHTAAMLG